MQINQILLIYDCLDILTILHCIRISDCNGSNPVFDISVINDINSLERINMIVTFASRKGGSGKSTLATNIATARKKAGFDVCLGDLDDQRSSETWAAVRAQNQIDPYIPVTCASGKGVMQAMQAQATKYQDLILDVPGRDAIELRAAELLADIVVIPLQPSSLDLWVFEKDLEVIKEAKVHKEASGSPFRVIVAFNSLSTSPNVRNREIANLHEFLDQLKEDIEEIGVEIYPGYVCSRSAISRSIDMGMGVIEMKTTSASDEHAVHEIKQLYNFIYGDK